MKHTPEPWHWEYDKFGNYRAIVGDGHVLCEAMQYDSESPSINISVPDSARIVACVNGCAGLNPEAFRDVVEALDVIVGFAGFNLENIEAGYAALAKARAV